MRKLSEHVRAACQAGADGSLKDYLAAVSAACEECCENDGAHPRHAPGVDPETGEYEAEKDPAAGDDQPDEREDKEQAAAEAVEPMGVGEANDLSDQLNRATSQCFDNVNRRRVSDGSKFRATAAGKEFLSPEVVRAGNAFLAQLVTHASTRRG